MNDDWNDKDYYDLNDMEWLHELEEKWLRLYGQKLEDALFVRTADAMEVELAIKSWLFGSDTQLLWNFLSRSLFVLRKEMNKHFPKPQGTISQAELLFLLIHMQYKLALSQAVVASVSESDALDCEATAKRLRGMLKHTVEDMDAFASAIWASSRAVFPCKDRLPEDLAIPENMKGQDGSLSPSNKPA